MNRLDSLATATLDELPTSVAVLDGNGEVVFANRAWRACGDEPGDGDPGSNYVAAVDAADDVYAERAAVGLRSVLDGRRDVFALEYPCRSPDRERWFLLRATRVDGVEPPRVVVLRVDVTGRKLAELETRRTARQLRAERRNLEHLLDRIDGLLGSVTRVLVSARSREEVERRTCEVVVDSAPFVAAWTARPDLAGSRLTVTARAGEPTGADGRPPVGGDSPAAGTDSFPADGDSLPADGDHPAARAVATGEVRVADGPGDGDGSHGDAGDTGDTGDTGNIDDTDRPGDAGGTDNPGGRRPATAGSLVAVPLAHRDERFGVLVVHADRPGAFDERERDVLGALGRALANAVRALEHKKLLAADTAVELTVETDDPGLFFVDLSAGLDASLGYEGSVYRSDGSMLTFLSVPDDAAPAAVRLASEHPTVLDSGIVSETDSRAIVEFAVRDSLVERLADAGGAVRDLSADRGRARLRVEFPDQATARAAFERLAADHDADLVSQRDRERPARTAGEFRDELEDALTDRQLTVLRKSYASGFFEWPRPTTGDELAASMGIARSTFHQHLRAAERKLLDALFEG